MAVLLLLCLFQGIVRIEEIAARIVAVRVKEQVVKLLIQLVVVSRMPARQTTTVCLQETADRKAEPAHETGETWQRRMAPTAPGFLQVAANKVQERVNVAAIDRQSPLCVGFSEGESWVQKQLPMQAPIVQPDRNRGCSIVAKGMPLVASVNDNNTSPTNEPFKQSPKEHRRVLRPAPPSSSA